MLVLCTVLILDGYIRGVSSWVRRVPRRKFKLIHYLHLVVLLRGRLYLVSFKVWVPQDKYGPRFWQTYRLHVLSKLISEMYLCLGFIWYSRVEALSYKNAGILYPLSFPRISESGDEYRRIVKTLYIFQGFDPAPHSISSVPSEKLHIAWKKDKHSTRAERLVARGGVI